MSKLDKDLPIDKTQITQVSQNTNKLHPSLSLSQIDLYPLSSICKTTNETDPIEESNILGSRFRNSSQNNLSKLSSAFRENPILLKIERNISFV